MLKRLLILSCLFVLTQTGLGWADAPALRISVDHGVPLTLSAPAASVFIANPEIADVQVMSPNSIMIFGKRTGETTFMASDSAGHNLAQRTIVVMQDLSNLRQELDTAIPGNKIKASALPNGIVLTGEAKDPSAVADAYKLTQRYLSQGGDIINRIKVIGGNQIHIRVRFAEVQRNIDNTLGFNWQNLNTVGGFMFGLATGETTGASSVDTGPNINNALGSKVGAIPGILSNRPSNTSLNLRNDLITVQHGGVNALIDALEQNGLITILAEPNLTAMSGETASFLAGGEFPIPIPQGNGTISIEFKKYGISLEFTPTLVTESRINLHVKPEVSELTQLGAITSANITVPALTTRKAETTVELGSGQSFAIAGLLDNNQAQTINEYPVLGDLPIIGALFRSTHFVSGQTELVVIITPYIVKPSGEQMALPMDGFSPPSDAERLVGLRYSASDPEARHMSGEPTAKMVDPAPAVSVVAPAPAPIAAPVTEVMPVPGGNAVAVNPAPVAPAAPATKTVPSSVTTVTTQTTKPISLSPARSAPVPLRGSSDSTGTMAPIGPGGFIVE